MLPPFFLLQFVKKTDLPLTPDWLQEFREVDALFLLKWGLQVVCFGMSVAISTVVFYYLTDVTMFLVYFLYKLYGSVMVLLLSFCKLIYYLFILLFLF